MCQQVTKHLGKFSSDTTLYLIKNCVIENNERFPNLIKYTFKGEIFLYICRFRYKFFLKYVSIRYLKNNYSN